MFSFSIHLIAEKLNINRDEIFDRYEEIEREMLSEFFDFVGQRIDNSIWIHWNMSNINYGFEALEHRYTILTNEESKHINENNKYNLSRILKKKFGNDYVKDPKMKSLMQLNGGLHRDFLNGQEEVSAFKAKEFLKLHKSTMCKVYFFNEVYENLIKNKLRTDKNGFKYKVSTLSQNPIVQIISIIGAVATVLGLIF